MKLINEQEIYDTWAPVIESKTGITEIGKKTWLSTYCHYHSLNESASAFQTLGNLNGMGNPAAPIFPTGNANTAFYNPANFGSGDKFPSLLPLAIQVAAKTIGFDIVPVIPMSGPTGVLTYLDYVYSGGKIDASGSTNAALLTNSPDLIKFEMAPDSAAPSESNVGSTYYIAVTGATSGTLNYVEGKFVGYSRIDDFPIFEVTAVAGQSIGSTVVAGAQVYASSLTGSVAGQVLAKAVLVKALEDHIQGFSGAGFTDSDNWQGPYVDGTKTYNPMLRGTGESTYYRSMGLSTFTKFVEADTFQVAASVTTEQIQDLNKQFGIDVISMIENALVNEVSQAINKHILSRAFALGWTNHINFLATEGQNLNINLVIGNTGAGNTSAYITKTDANKTMAIPDGPASGGYENLSTLQRRLFSRILAAANVVANRGRRGPANFIVTNSAVASALQDISQFTFAPFTNTLTQNNGTLYPVGSLAGMTVYVDQNMKYTDTRVLVGRKGGDDEPGLKFMPYMMAESIQTISEGTMSPKIAVKSRYALVEAGQLPETMYVTFYVKVPTGGLS